MATKTLTVEELKSQIKDVTIPLIKEHAGREVAEVVAQAVKAELDKQPSRMNYADKLHEENKGTEKAIKGQSFARYVRCLAVAKNDRERAVSVAQKLGYTDVAQ